MGRGIVRGSVPQIFVVRCRMASSLREPYYVELSVIVPTDSVRHIIGKGGRTIQEIQRRCNNAHVSPGLNIRFQTTMTIHAYTAKDAIDVRNAIYDILRADYGGAIREDQARGEMVQLISGVPPPRRGGSAPASASASASASARMPPPTAAAAPPAAPAVPARAPNTRTEEEKLIPKGLLNFRRRRASRSTRRRLPQTHNKSNRSNRTRR